MHLIHEDKPIDMAPIIARRLYTTGHEIDWDKLPSEHTMLLLQSLARYQLSDLSWAFKEDVKIEKTKDRITFSDGENELRIELDLGSPRAIVTLNGRTPLGFPVRVEDGHVSIQRVNRSQPPSPQMSEKQANRLVYWGDLKLFDYISNPRATSQDEEELLRNITLSVSTGKLVKKFGDAAVIIPTAFKHALLNEKVKETYNDSTTQETVEDAAEWEIVKTTRISYRGRLKPNASGQTVTLMDAFKEYLDSSLSSRSYSIRSDLLNFEFTPPGTNYEISFSLVAGSAG